MLCCLPLPASCPAVDSFYSTTDRMDTDVESELASDGKSTNRARASSGYSSQGNSMYSRMRNDSSCGAFGVSLHESILLSLKRGVRELIEV